MIISVVSRRAASEYTKKNPDLKTAIISITDIGEPDNDLTPQPNIVDILRLKFDDVGPLNPGGFKAEDAKRIAEFVNRHKGEVEQIMVHCEAGVSRSAGVGAAIAYVLNGNNDEFFHSSFYYPNRYVFFLTLQAFFEQEESKNENPN